MEVHSLRSQSVCKVDQDYLFYLHTSAPRSKATVRNAVEQLALLAKKNVSLVVENFCNRLKEANTKAQLDPSAVLLTTEFVKSLFDMA